MVMVTPAAMLLLPVLALAGRDEDESGGTMVAPVVPCVTFAIMQQAASMLCECSVNYSPLIRRQLQLQEFKTRQSH